jgi:phosphoribosylglycinamide formyltransferase-1
VSERVQVGVLLSGGGTNLQALIDAAADASYPAQIAVVLSNRERAGGLDRARAAGIPASFISHRDKTREVFDADLVAALQAHGCQWVVLAGFMRIITPVLLDAFPGRVLNIHPALLPAFPGVHAQKQALDAGVRITGATVHLVDAGMDTGPIIAQGAVPRHGGDTLDDLQQRILAVEHRLLPMVLRWAAEGRVRVESGGVAVDLKPSESRYLWDA